MLAFNIDKVAKVLQQSLIQFFQYALILMILAAWSAAYFASIKFFEKKVESSLKLAFGPDFVIKDHPSAVVFSQLLSGSCFKHKFVFDNLYFFFHLTT